MRGLARLSPQDLYDLFTLHKTVAAIVAATGLLIIADGIATIQLSEPREVAENAMVL